MVKTTQVQLAGIKDKVSMFKPGTEVLPGINVLDTAGHTPGHVSFEMSGGDGLGGGLFPVPGKKFLEAPDGVIGDAGQDVCEPSLWVDVVELGSADQGVDRCGALTATVGAGEQPGFAPEGDAAQGAQGLAAPREGRFGPDNPPYPNQGRPGKIDNRWCRSMVRRRWPTWR